MSDVRRKKALDKAQFILNMTRDLNQGQKMTAEAVHNGILLLTSPPMASLVNNAWIEHVENLRQEERANNG